MTSSRCVAVLDSLGDLAKVEVGVVIDLLLSFASLGAHQEMVDLVEHRMGPTVKSMTVVREQYGLALNRVGRVPMPNRCSPC